MASENVKAELTPYKKSKLAKLELSIHELAMTKGQVRLNGKTASLGTVRTTINVATESAKRLHALGYEIEHIDKLGERHIRALVEDWERCGLADKTMQNQLSRLRMVANWIGKPTMIPKGQGVFHFLPDVKPRKVVSVAMKGKSWSDCGIDVVIKIKEADAIDRRFGMMLRIALAFGLRRKEQLMGMPWAMDAGAELLINSNMAKNGRDRTIEIHHPFQRAVLDYAKKVCKKGEFMGWPGHTYEQNINRYKYLMRVRLGITRADAECVGHGLRAEFVENEAMLRGLLPPTMGGKADQMSKEEREQIELAISRNTGRNRTSVMGAYYGSFRKLPANKSQTGRLGTIIVNVDRDAVGIVYANPVPAKLADGTYRKLNAAEAKAISFSVVFEESGVEVGAYVSEFLEGRPDLKGKMDSILQRIGITGGSVGEGPSNWQVHGVLHAKATSATVET